MRWLTYVFLSALSTLSLSMAIACGGDDLTDENIKNSKELQAVMAQIHGTYGQEVVVEEVVRSGAQILNLDKKVVLMAMCSANYHHVYLKSNSGDLRCMVVFEPDRSGHIKVEGKEIRIGCAVGAGNEELVIAPF